MTDDTGGTDDTGDTDDTVIDEASETDDTDGTDDADEGDEAGEGEAPALGCWGDADRTRSDPELSVRPDGRLELGVPDDPERWLATDAPAELGRWV